MGGIQERRDPLNGAGRRCYDGYCPLHPVHHDAIETLQEDMKGKVSMKLFGIFIGSATALIIFIGGIMISGQREVAKSIVEIKTTQAKIEAKIEVGPDDRARRFYHDP